MTTPIPVTANSEEAFALRLLADELGDVLDFANPMMWRCGTEAQTAGARIRWAPRRIGARIGVPEETVKGWLASASARERSAGLWTLAYVFSMQDPVPCDARLKSFPKTLSQLGTFDRRSAFWAKPWPRRLAGDRIVDYATAIDGARHAEAMGLDLHLMAVGLLEGFERYDRWDGTFAELRCCLFYLARKQHAPTSLTALWQPICELWEVEQPG